MPIHGIVPDMEKYHAKVYKEARKETRSDFQTYDTIRNHRGLRANQWASALGYIGF